MKLLKDLKIGVMALALAIAGAGVMPAAVFADDTGSSLNKIKDIKPGGLGESISLTEKVKTLINTLLGVIGMVSVIMIIYGGFLYTTSAGESDKVKKAKNTILYGVIGLVVALLSFAIVQFVLTTVLSTESKV